MKNILFLLMPFFYVQLANAQILNWNALNNKRHIINANFGLDYGVTYGIGYAYKLNTKIPMVLNVNFSIPAGEKVLDDFRSNIGGQVVVWNSSKFKGVVALKGIYRRYQNPFVTLQNFGSEANAAFGYYRSRWFLAFNAGFDKAIVTHFKHSKRYKEDIYPDVVDGWYEPATGGNFSYGLQSGYSFKKMDITIDVGNILTQDFKTTPTLPFYFRLGYNYKF